jgi:hypothetical protein
VLQPRPTLTLVCWQRDALKQGRMISVEEAATLPGTVVPRYPPSTSTGHIVLLDCKGGALEAMGATFGVVSDRLNGRRMFSHLSFPILHAQQYPGLARERSLPGLMI